MIAPTIKDLGREVIYRTAGQPDEAGMLTGINRVSSQYVFVRYGRDKHSKATHVNLLSWASQKMTTADFLTALRALGMTQRALADELGLDPHTVSRWATGRVEVPKYATAYLLLKQCCKCRYVGGLPCEAKIP